MSHILELVGIGSMIKLRRPSGATWHVGLIKLGEKLVIEPGWEDFVNANYVSPNDLLVFKHVGRIEFEVLIFDPWGCEKSGIEEIIRNTSIPLVPRDKSNMYSYVEKSHKIQEERGYNKAIEISETETSAKKRSNQKSSKQAMFPLNKLICK